MIGRTLGHYRISARLGKGAWARLTSATIITETTTRFEVGLTGRLQTSPVDASQPDSRPTRWHCHLSPLSPIQSLLS